MALKEASSAAVPFYTAVILAEFAAAPVAASAVALFLRTISAVAASSALNIARYSATFASFFLDSSLA